MPKAKKKPAAKRRGKGSTREVAAKARKVAKDNQIVLTKPDQTLLKAHAAPQPSPRWDTFISEYVKDWNGARAAKAAGYSENTAKQIAYELLRIPYIAGRVAEIKAEIEAKQREALDEKKDDVNKVLRKLRLMVDADPRELSRIEQRCCRYCWGIDNRYQYTVAELQMERGAFEKKLIETRKDIDLDKRRDLLMELMEDFDQRGGGGFIPTRDPNPNCEECGGRGIDEVVFGDVRELSEGARLLYAGTKQTEKGLEVKTHSQFEALKLLGTHHGMFATRHKIGGDPENPAPINAGFAVIPPKRSPDEYPDTEATPTAPEDR